MRFDNTPRTVAVHWTHESCAQRILATLNAASHCIVVYEGMKLGHRDYYNVYAVYALPSNKRLGYVLECYDGGAYIVRPRLPSEPISGARRETVRVQPFLGCCSVFRGV